TGLYGRSAAIAPAVAITATRIFATWLAAEPARNGTLSAAITLPLRAGVGAASAQMLGENSPLSSGQPWRRVPARSPARRLGSLNVRALCRGSGRARNRASASGGRCASNTLPAAPACSGRRWPGTTVSAYSRLPSDTAQTSNPSLSTTETLQASPVVV